MTAAPPRLLKHRTVISCRWDTGGVMAIVGLRLSAKTWFDRRFSDFPGAGARGGGVHTQLQWPCSVVSMNLNPFHFSPRRQRLRSHCTPGSVGQYVVAIFRQIVHNRNCSAS